MLETHSMLRSDTTALFERLREANILLQEVLSGAHDNMSSLERTMVTRVSEFVAAMNDLNGKSNASTTAVEQHLGNFTAVTGKALHELGELATQFTTHGRTLAEAVELLDKSNRRSEDSVASRRASIETLVSTLDARTEDFGQRLQRFSSLLDESLDAATTRAREIASVVAETSNESVNSIEQSFALVRATSEEERRRTSETLNAVYDEAATQVHTMFDQSAARFTEIMQGMKQMAVEMQQELETTRAELRRGIFELPQETAESAAQMRRVIVDQIEALAELNRIVARHGRTLDTAEPVRREPEPAYAGGGRAPARPMRGDITATPQAAMRGDITGAPPRRPEQSPLNPAQNAGSGRNGGWLSDLLSRASREESPSIAPPAPREGARGEERPQREGIDSLDSLAVDVARMIDHEAAADLWERYKRGERGVFTRRLYTAQGQKAFDEIRRKYRADPEFRQTVEQYIHEFERLLEDVSRGDRGPAVVRSYLTSDTGKVYTMLAHAAGRFDQ
jgi:DNA anti-recombination protein RmuC